MHIFEIYVLTRVYTHDTITTLKMRNISIMSKNIFGTLCVSSLPPMLAPAPSYANTFCSLSLQVSLY